MNAKDRFDLATLSGRLRAAALAVDEAVKVLAAAEAAERLLDQVRRLAPPANATAVPRAGAMPTGGDRRSPALPERGSRVVAVFDQTPVARSHVAKKMTGDGIPF